MSELDGRIQVGISACLLGERVRFDSGHKQDAYILGTLSAWFEFLPVCPEVAIGLGVPRETIHLAETPNGIRVVGTRTPGLDVTDALTGYGAETARRMQAVSGFILKKDSPSCGMERVKVRQPTGMRVRSGVGAFARALMAGLPLLPVEEEGRLGDPVLRENFIERVFVYRRWQILSGAGITPAGLVGFHSDHKYLVMAHNQTAYRGLGRLVAEAGTRPLAGLAAEYVATLMATLRRPATRRGHANVLQHLAGYLRRRLDGEDRQELAEIIDQYRLGQLPLVVPITLLNHHFRRHPHPYIERQHYLHPHPAELMLRNQI